MASNMADSWDSSEVSGSEGVSWITWFCSLPGHEFFCEVQEEFIEDEFNLTGLRGMFPYYEEAIATIMDLEIGT
jgi:casein kinase II subunit beta